MAPRKEPLGVMARVRAKQFSAGLKVLAIVLALGAAIAAVPDLLPKAVAEWAPFSTAVAVGMQALATLIDTFVPPSASLS